MMQMCSMLFSLYFVLFLLARTRGSVLDQDSFLVTGMAEELVEIGNDFALNGDMDAAVGEWKKSLVIYPFNSKAKDALLQYAANLQELGKDLEAINMLLFVQSTAKVYKLEVLFNLASLYQRIGEIEEAANWYRKVLEHDPGHGSSRINLAALHHSHGSIEEAIKQYRLGLLHLGSYQYQQRLREASKSTSETTSQTAPETDQSDQSSDNGNHDNESWQPTYILDLEVMLRSNMAAGYIQLGKYNEARLVLNCLLSHLLRVSVHIHMINSVIMLYLYICVSVCRYLCYLSAS